MRGLKSVFLKSLVRVLTCVAGFSWWPGGVGVARGGGAELPVEVQQLVVGIAQDWDASRGFAQRFERGVGGGDGGGREGWRAVGKPWPVLFGKNGLAWGRGVRGEGEPGLQKVEKDRRAPAGVFALGTVYTYDRELPAGADYPFHTVTAADAWVDDPALPEYNRHVRVEDLAKAPPWFEKQRMRHGDFAYRWLVEIRHNADPPKSGAGSAIFFHLRRGVDRPSAGCTVMGEEDLVRMIRWLRAGKRPHYALLERGEYLAKWRGWGLPRPEAAAGLLR